MPRVARQLLLFIERRDHAIVVVLVTVVILLGLLYSTYLGNELRYLPDEQDYYDLATSIALRHRYSLDGERPTAYRPPGYPLFLSFSILLGANIVHLRFLNFMALGLCIYLLYRILKKQSSQFAATLGAVFVVCYPVLFYTAGTLYPQTVASLLFLLLIYLLTGNATSHRLPLLCGLLFGYLILTIPTFIFALFVFAIWSWFSKKVVGAKEFSVTLATALLIIGAWCARNYMVFDTFVFVSSNSGENLLRGNSENTTPNAGVTVDISEYATEAAQLNEIERDAYYRSKAIEFILGHKVHAVKLYVQKLLNYFNYRNELSTQSEASSAKDFLMLVTYGPLLLLFVCRILLVKLFRPSAFETLLISLYVSSALFAALFFTRIRFRLPFDFLLIMIVATFLRNAFRMWLGRFNAFPSTL